MHKHDRLKQDVKFNLRLDGFPRTMLVRKGGHGVWQNLTGELGIRYGGVVVEVPIEGTGRRLGNNSLAGTHPHTISDPCL